MRSLLLMCLVACVFSVIGNNCEAQGPKAHAIAMADSGTLMHSSGRVENVAQVGVFLPRVQALALYSQSQEHRQNFWSAPVRMVLTTRIARTGNGQVYVVNRGRFIR